MRLELVKSMLCIQNTRTTFLLLFLHPALFIRKQHPGVFNRVCLFVFNVATYAMLTYVNHQTVCVHVDDPSRPCPDKSCYSAAKTFYRVLISVSICQLH